MQSLMDPRLFRRSSSTKPFLEKLVDSKGESIIGANVMEKGTTNGTITDFDGNFSLKVSANSVIVISYIGSLVSR